MTDAISMPPIPTGSSPVIPLTEFAKRQEGLRNALKDAGFAAGLIWSRGGSNADYYGNVMYLTNHHDPLPQLHDTHAWTARPYSAVLLLSDGPCVLLVHNHDYVERDVHADAIEVCAHVPQRVTEIIAARGLAGSHLALMGRETLLHTHYELLAAGLGPRGSFTPADFLLDQMRLRKTDAELIAIRHAATVGIGWMNTMMEGIKEHRTEAEVVADGFRFLVTNGGYPYDVAIGSGPKSEHYQRVGMPSCDWSRPLEMGDLVHIDAWGPVGGYYTDFCRSTVVGRKTTGDQRALLEACVDLIYHIIDGVTPEVTVGDLYTRGQTWMRSHGFADPTFGELFPCFGHGIGLGLEHPWIIENEPTVLEPNMVLAIEIMLTQDGVGGAGFEENVLVTEEGYEVLTESCASQWWE